MLLRRLGLPIGMLFAAAGALAQTPSAAKPAADAHPNNAFRYRLLGVFEESGEPLEGVEVSDVLTGNKSLTTATGTVSLLFLPEGASFVRLRKVGYSVQTFPVTISPADTSAITVILERVSTTLPTVVVKDSAPKKWIGPLKGFEERRRIGIGHFIPDSILRHDEGRPLMNTIIAHVPGVTLVAGKGGTSYLVTAKQCAMAKGRPPGPICSNAPCFVRVFQDGSLVYDGDPKKALTSGIDLQHLTTDTWGGVEYYAGGAEVPPQYGGTGGDCGTLLLWTRER